MILKTLFKINQGKRLLKSIYLKIGLQNKKFNYHSQLFFLRRYLKKSQRHQEVILETRKAKTKLKKVIAVNGVLTQINKIKKKMFGDKILANQINILTMVMINMDNIINKILIMKISSLVAK